jgi:hypothetical protein
MPENKPGTERKAPPLYENDMAWSPERKDRVEKLYEATDARSKSRVELMKETSVLIEELGSAVRSNPKTPGGVTIHTQSQLMSEMLYLHYRLSQEPDWEVKKK